MWKIIDLPRAHSYLLNGVGVGDQTQVCRAACHTTLGEVGTWSEASGTAWTEVGVRPRQLPSLSCPPCGPCNRAHSLPSLTRLDRSHSCSQDTP